MWLKYLPANQAWVFIFGDDINTATIQDMAGFGRFFNSRKSAVTAANANGIAVAENGRCSVVK
jgi:hypothetical protein